MEYSVVNESERDVEPFPFVYIEENGSFRELTKEEKQYLIEKFHPNDGDRPYVKGRYKARNPDGSISGYCARNMFGISASAILILRKWTRFEPITTGITE